MRNGSTSRKFRVNIHSVKHLEQHVKQHLELLDFRRHLRNMLRELRTRLRRADVIRLSSRLIRNWLYIHVIVLQKLLLVYQRHSLSG